MKRLVILFLSIQLCVLVMSQKDSMLNELDLAIKSDPSTINYLKKIHFCRNWDWEYGSVIIHDIETLIPLTKDSSLLYSLYAEAGYWYDRQKNYPKSYENYTSAIQIGKKLKKIKIPAEYERYVWLKFYSSEIYWDRAFSLYNQKKYIEAQKEFNTYGAKEGRAAIGLGMCYYALGNKAMAISLFKSTLEKERTIPNKQREFFMACNELARVYENDANYAEAIKYVKLANSYCKGFTGYEYILWLAKLYKNNGEQTKACEAAKQRINMNNSTSKPENFKAENEKLLKEFCGE